MGVDRKKMMPGHIQVIHQQQQDHPYNSNIPYGRFIVGDHPTEHQYDSPNGRYYNCIHIFFQLQAASYKPQVAFFNLSIIYKILKNLTYSLAADSLRPTTSPSFLPAAEAA